MIREFMQSASRPWEISAMVKLKLSGIGRVKTNEPLEYLASSVNDIEFCYAALNKVSRSFAVVIRHLPYELRDSVCIFYLVLRGLDSIEDDTDFPNREKLPLLRTFYTKNNDTDWRINGVGDSPDYRTLLANYDKISRSFQRLDKKSQAIIIDTCKKMGVGMAEFSERPVNTIAEYNLYCHYVAGLVGIGLSELFAISGVENTALNNQAALSNSMGLFLQKTNIVRDYHEDLHAGRSFWPEEIWGQYVDNLSAFEGIPYAGKSLACLNHFVADALQHATDSLAYLAQINNPEVFRFCAIPQAMAMATLSKVYNNPNVFSGVVKIRKGLAAMMMMELNDFQSVKSYFDFFAQEMLNNINTNDPHHEIISEKLFEIMRMSKHEFLPELETVN